MKKNSKMIFQLIHCAKFHFLSQEKMSKKTIAISKFALQQVKLTAKTYRIQINCSQIDMAADSEKKTPIGGAIMPKWPEMSLFEPTKNANR